MQEEYILRSGLWSMFGATEVWIAVAYLAGMFLVLAFRPQQIVAPWSFRLSCTLFALCFIVPGIMNAILLLTLLDGATRGGNQAGMVLFQLSSPIGKVFLGLSIAFALGAMIPPRKTGSPSANRMDGDASA
jgi:hypothetical protein